MAFSPTTLEIPDLTEEARNELSRELPPDAIRFKRVGGDEPLGREITSIVAVVTVSLAALKVVAAWIARRVAREETELSVQVQQPDGSVRTLTYRSKKESSQLEAEVLKQLATVCRVGLPQGVSASPTEEPTEDNS